MIELSSHAQGLINAQIDRYETKLPERRIELEMMWTRVIANSGRQDSVCELIRFLHRMAGSAGNFGFKRLGWAAGALEQALKSQQHQPDQISRDCQALLDQLLTEIDFSIKARVVG